MKKICLIIISIFLSIACSGCINRKLDLEKLYKKNGELATKFFYGFVLEDWKHELFIFEPENATAFELELCRPYNLDGVEKVLYVKYERTDMMPYVVALQYKSVKLAKKVCESSRPKFTYLREKNILALPITPAYMFIYGNFKDVDGYYLTPDGKNLLFDIQAPKRTEIVIPEGVKYVPAYALYSGVVETIICNKELERLHAAAFLALHTLEKVELNEGLKEIGSQCFPANSNLEYIVIPESVEMIGFEAFQNVRIYCEAEKKPMGWDRNFMGENCTIYWKGSWKYVDGIPKPIGWIER